jgi:hypothetical protein
MSAYPAVPPVVPQPANRIELSLLVIILLVALGLRVWAIDFGLPYLYHPDEPSKIEIAQNIVKTGDLNPLFQETDTAHLRQRPAVPALLCRGEGQRRIHHHRRHSSTGAPEHGSRVHRRTRRGGHGANLDRFVGVLGVLLTWVVGRRLFGRPEPALFAALATAVSPVNVIQSHFIETNSFLGTAVLAVAWYACESMTTARAGTISWRDFSPGRRELQVSRRGDRHPAGGGPLDAFGPASRSRSVISPRPSLPCRLGSSCSRPSPCSIR